MSAIAKVEQLAPMATMLEMISRAAADPNTDVTKLERLLQMAREVRADDAKTAYFTDLAEMQDELPSVEERGEIKIGNGPGQKYALWEDINKAIKPIMKKHGFAISFRTGFVDGKITVTGVLSHRAGHSEETTIHLPSDNSGSKNAVQAVGSSTSYGKRYTACALLNLTSGGEDDDGEGEGGYHASPLAHAIHGQHTMRQDEDQIEGVKNFIEQNKAFLKNCKTVAEIQDWVELREPELHRLKRRDLTAWNDLRMFKERCIANINLAPAK